jgi:hypothetical protein
MARLEPRRRSLKGEHSRERGATIFEFALILPMFILLVFGIVEFGHTWYLYHTAVNASREGARYGIVYRNKVGVTPAERWPPAQWGGALPSIETRVKDYLKQFFGAEFVDTKVTVSLSGANPGDPPGDESNEPLTVTVVIPKSWLVLGPLIGMPDVPLTAATTMKLE